MIPENGWKPMDQAPKDGSVIVVKYRQFNTEKGKTAIQFGQWLCDENGTNWAWRKPWHMGTTVHADAWMTLADFQKSISEEKTAVEFDL